MELYHAKAAKASSSAQLQTSEFIDVYRVMKVVKCHEKTETGANSVD